VSVELLVDSELVMINWEYGNVTYPVAASHTSHNNTQAPRSDLQPNRLVEMAL
jgi:hypothetical protein